MASKLAPSHEPELKVELSYGSASDVSAIMPIMQSSFAEEFGEAWNHQQCYSMLLMRGSRLLIAKVNGHPAGFVMSRIAADEEEVMMIAVMPEFQGRAIGQQLIEQTIATAKSENCYAIFLEVRDGNGARQLYDKMGFEQIGVRKNYYTGKSNDKFDAITLKKVF